MLNAVSFVYAQRIAVPEPGEYFTNTDKYEVLDTCKYEIHYNLSYVLDTTLKTIKAPIEDVCVLQIGKRVSKTYSESIYETDSIDHAEIKKGANAVPMLQKVVPPVEVFKGYPSGQMTVTHLAVTSDFVFRYTEPEPKQDWEIGTATKKILGYDCTEATCSYRGRDYVAWFTTAIPLEDGPWMFGGLPGLILAIHDTKNQYDFQCIGISQQREPIKMFERKYKVGERSVIRRDISQMYAHLNNYIPRLYVKHRYGPLEKVSDAYMPYNPIELK
ncbi:MAG: GLPGLI family protein [Tannerella sp.]|jgi:GLPGLI family protein|nr:GLPGLI family protein [Tannerella sp.]